MSVMTIVKGSSADILLSTSLHRHNSNYDICPHAASHLSYHCCIPRVVRHHSDAVVVDHELPCHGTWQGRGEGNRVCLLLLQTMNFLASHVNAFIHIQICCIRHDVYEECDRSHMALGVSCLSMPSMYSTTTL